MTGKDTVKMNDVVLELFRRSHAADATDCCSPKECGKQCVSGSLMSIYVSIGCFDEIGL